MFSAFLALASCRQAEVPPKPAATKLSATELFALRTKCAALGEKILQDNSISPALTHEQVSHYNTETGHCYVKLEDHTANPDSAENYMSDEVLYDGQTGERLASASMQGKDKKSAWISSTSLQHFAHDSAYPPYEEARDLIDKFVAEDRKP